MIKLGGCPMKKILQITIALLAIIMLLDKIIVSIHLKKLSKPYY